MQIIKELIQEETDHFDKVPRKEQNIKTLF